MRRAVTPGCRPSAAKDSSEFVIAVTEPDAAEPGGEALDRGGGVEGDGGAVGHEGEELVGDGVLGPGRLGEAVGERLRPERHRPAADPVGDAEARPARRGPAGRSSRSRRGRSASSATRTWPSAVELGPDLLQAGDGVDAHGSEPRARGREPVVERTTSNMTRAPEPSRRCRSRPGAGGPAGSGPTRPRPPTAAAPAPHGRAAHGARARRGARLGPGPLRLGVAPRALRQRGGRGPRARAGQPAQAALRRPRPGAAPPAGRNVIGRDRHPLRRTPCPGTSRRPSWPTTSAAVRSCFEADLGGGRWLVTDDTWQGTVLDGWTAGPRPRASRVAASSTSTPARCRRAGTTRIPDWPAALAAPGDDRGRARTARAAQLPLSARSGRGRSPGRRPSCIALVDEGDGGPWTERIVVGTLVADVEGPAGATVTVRAAEFLDAAGRPAPNEHDAGVTFTLDGSRRTLESLDSYGLQGVLVEVSDGAVAPRPRAPRAAPPGGRRGVVPLLRPDSRRDLGGRPTHGVDLLDGQLPRLPHPRAAGVDRRLGGPPDGRPHHERRLVAGPVAPAAGGLAPRRTACSRWPCAGDAEHFDFTSSRTGPCTGSTPCGTSTATSGDRGGDRPRCCRSSRACCAGSSRSATTRACPPTSTPG